MWSITALINIDQLKTGHILLRNNSDIWKMGRLTSALSEIQILDVLLPFMTTINFLDPYLTNSCLNYLDQKSSLDLQNLTYYSHLYFLKQCNKSNFGCFQLLFQKLWQLLKVTWPFIIWTLIHDKIKNWDCLTVPYCIRRLLNNFEICL